MFYKMFGNSLHIKQYINTSCFITKYYLVISKQVLMIVNNIVSYSQLVHSQTIIGHYHIAVDVLNGIGLAMLPNHNSVYIYSMLRSLTGLF